MENEKNELTLKDGNKDNIKELGLSLIKNSEGNIYCLTIVGEIEGHTLSSPQAKTTKYEHILPLLVAIEADEEIDGIIIILNTVGGDVEAGLAISELISGMKKPSVSLVLGGGHSIGVPLAVSAKHSFIAPTATMTIHPIRMSGQIIGAPQTYEYLKKIQDRVVNFIANNSNAKKEEIERLMLSVGEMSNDIGSIVKGEDAVKIGLIDECGTISDALLYLYGMIKTKEKGD